MFTNVLLTGSYDYRLAALSVLIAILAAYAALDLAGRVTTARRGVRLAWLCGGSLAMGGGIWAMHYVGMEAFHLPVPVTYDWPTVLLSLFAAILAAAIALYAVSRRTVSLRHMVAGGIFMGGGIAAMHYIGMHAMRLPATCVYSPWLVLLSVILAIVVSFVALQQAFRFRETRTSGGWRKLSTAVLMGLAIPTTHYVGMSAVHFVATPSVTDQDSVSVFSLGLATIVVATLLTLGLVFLSSIVDRRFLAQAQRLVERELQLQAVFDNMNEGVFVLDRNGKTVLANEAGLRLIGAPEDKNANEQAAELFEVFLPTGEFLPLDQRPVARALRGEFVQSFELIFRRKSTGETDTREISTAPVPDANGHYGQVIVTYRDITESKQFEKYLQQSQKMEAIGELTGGVAHDFNNMLSVIVGNLDLIERLAADNETILKRVKTAQRAARRGAELTHRLLAFSRNAELKAVPTNLQHSVRNVMELAHAFGPEFRIVNDFHDDSNTRVLVDPAGLENALLNLMVNARDAMPKGGTLTISTQISNLEENYPAVRAGELDAGRFAHISVSDQGHGMSKETLDRVFEPFFTTKPQGKGTGLGLAMVYGFAKQSHGVVRIYSEPGYGTTVSIYLPLAETGAQPIPVPIRGLPQAKSSGNVLVVDDEPDILEIAVAYLEEMGYTVHQANDGVRALEALKQQKNIDLLVSDLIMPGGMNGAELAQMARELAPDIKVIYCSGFAAGILEERNMPLVHGPLLNKPYQRKEFEAIIRSAMKSPEGEL
jgi:PAS domain S-box-containing protein